MHGNLFAGFAAIGRDEPSAVRTGPDNTKRMHAWMGAIGCWFVHGWDSSSLFRLIEIQGNVQIVFKRFRTSFHALAWAPAPPVLQVAFTLWLPGYRTLARCGMDRIWGVGVHTRIDCFQM
jgi:hypothetical protein